MGSKMVMNVQMSRVNRLVLKVSVQGDFRVKPKFLCRKDLNRRNYAHRLKHKYLWRKVCFLIYFVHNIGHSLLLWLSKPV